MGAYEDQPSLLRKLGALAKKVSALERTQDQIPAGTFQYTGRTSAPPGYLMCDGSQVSRTAYAGLFAAIGTRYGSGDGSTTFHLPLADDGRFLRGNAGSGASGGTDTHVHAVAVNAHSHTMAHVHAFTTGNALYEFAQFVAGDTLSEERVHHHTGTTDGSSAASTGDASPGGSADERSHVPKHVDCDVMIKT